MSLGIGPPTVSFAVGGDRAGCKMTSVDVSVIARWNSGGTGRSPKPVVESPAVDLVICVARAGVTTTPGADLYERALRWRALPFLVLAPAGDVVVGVGRQSAAIAQTAADRSEEGVGGRRGPVGR